MFSQFTKCQTMEYETLSNVNTTWVEVQIKDMRFTIKD